jgi:pyruvate formate lyase activating enzyme
VVKESLLYDRKPDGRVVCNVCAVRCVIPVGSRGACRTRVNEAGRLYTLLYGVASSVCVDPVEKKPVFHYLPGSRILSMGTRGCNFRCPGCQNWEISHDAPAADVSNLEAVDPVESARLAVRLGCQGIGWTYNDPTIWLEHTLEAMKEAKRLGLYTAYMTNGYATPEQMDLLAPHLDVWRVDLKGCSREAYKRITGLARWEPVLEATLLAHRAGMHVECVTNVTPTLNDDEVSLRGIARWIRERLGSGTPWHVTRFHPYLDLSHLPATPISTLERAAAIGREEGLRFVYLGNVPGHPLGDTACPGCGELVIRRRGFAVAESGLVDGACPACGERIPGRFPSRVAASSGERFRV